MILRIVVRWGWGVGPSAHARNRRRRQARVRNVILPRYHIAIDEARGDVVRKVGVERRQHGDALGHAAERAQQVNGRLEAAGKEARARQEQVADAGARKVEAAAGPHALDHLEVEAVEVGADELPLGRGDVAPQRVRRLDHVEPLAAGGGGDLGEAMVEEVLDGGRLGAPVVGNQPDQARPDIADACGGSCQHAIGVACRLR